MILIMTGLVILPMQTANAKTEGFIDFMRTWPVKRGVILFADTVVWLMCTIPGIVIATIVAHFAFQPGYQITWTIFPAVLLTAFTSIGVGYGFSYALPPYIAMMLSQVLVFGALMFSPINFPIERLPQWLQVVHRILPLHSMAVVIRASLASSTFSAGIEHYLNLIAWCILGYIGSVFILNRR